MKKCLGIFVMIIFVALLCGCGRSGVSSGKWLDYGSGMINLDTVNKIAHGIDRGANSEELGNEFAGAIVGVDLSTSKAVQNLTRDEWEKAFKGQEIDVTAYFEFDDFRLEINKETVKNFRDFDRFRDRAQKNISNLATFLASQSSYADMNRW